MELMFLLMIHNMLIITHGIRLEGMKMAVIRLMDGFLVNILIVINQR